MEGIQETKDFISDLLDCLLPEGVKGCKECSRVHVCSLLHQVVFAVRQMKVGAA